MWGIYMSILQNLFLFSLFILFINQLLMKSKKVITRKHKIIFFLFLFCVYLFIILYIPINKIRITDFSQIDVSLTKTYMGNSYETTLEKSQKEYLLNLVSELNLTNYTIARPYFYGDGEFAEITLRGQGILHNPIRIYISFDELNINCVQLSGNYYSILDKEKLDQLIEVVHEFLLQDNEYDKKA